MKPIALSLIAMQIAWSSPPSIAGSLDDAVNHMFVTSSTDFRAYNNQARSGLIGGGVSMRSPVRSVTLLQFDAPRYNASCGGIDMFAGAFSFINTDQLVQLFRAVAANAVAVLFKAAIEAISPQIGKLMSDFEAKVRQLNSLMKNSCQIANQILNPSTSPSASLTEAQGKLSSIVTEWGNYSDMFKSTSQFFQDPAGSFKAALAKVTNPSTGAPLPGAAAAMRDTTLPWNTTWQMLSDSEAERYIGNPTMSGTPSSPTFTRRVLMSLVGTYVGPNASQTVNSAKVSQAPSETAPGGTSAPTTSNKEEVTPARWFEPTLSISEFVDGSQKATIYKCGDNETTCLKPIKEDNVRIIGLRTYVHRMLFGDDDYTGDSLFTGSIVHRLQNCVGTSCGFTNEQKGFISQVPVPTLKYLRDVQENKYAVYAVAKQLEPLIVDAMAERYLSASLKAIRLGLSGHKSVTPDEKILERVREIEKVVIDYRAKEREKIHQILALHEYVSAIRKTNSAILVKASR